MAPDIRDTLRLGVPEREPLPDMEAILHRKRKLAWQRRAVMTAGVGVLVGLGFLTGSRVLDLAGPEITPARTPPPRWEATDPGTAAPFPREVVGLLRGRHRTIGFSPEVRFTIPENDRWIAYQDEKAVVVWGLGSSEQDISVQRWDLAAEDVEVAGSPAGGPVEWLKAHPYLRVRSVGPSSFAGRSATLVKALVERSGPRAFMTLGGEPWTYESGNSAWFYIFGSDTGPMAAVIRAPQRSFSFFLDDARPILRSIRVAG